MKTSSPKKGVISFVADGIAWNLTGGIGYQIYLCCLAAFMVLGVYAYSVQANLGLAATNMSNIVSWGFYIANFTFLVGVAAAAVMIILPAYIFKDKDFHRGVIIGEGVAAGALVSWLMFVRVVAGAPTNIRRMVSVMSWLTGGAIFQVCFSCRGARS